MKKTDLKNMNINFILKSSSDLIKKYLSVSEAKKYRAYCRNAKYTKAIGILKKALKKIDISKIKLINSLEKNIIENEGENKGMKESIVTNESTVTVENSKTHVEKSTNSGGYIAAIIIVLAIVALIVTVLVKKKSGNRNTEENQSNFNYNKNSKSNSDSEKIFSTYSDADRDLLEVIHLLADTYNTTEDYLK